MNAFASLFFDHTNGGYSMSRVVMFGTFLITFAFGILTAFIVFDTYSHNKPIPDISWLFYGGGISGGTGVVAYGMNRFGSTTTGQPFEDTDGEDCPEIAGTDGSAKVPDEED